MAEPGLADPERALTLAYAPAPVRAALATLWRLDERLGGVVASTRDEQIGAIRLAWWREALARLDEATPPDEPLLQEVARELLPAGLRGAAIGEVANGWGAILAPLPLDAEALAQYASSRGARLFGLAGDLLGGGEGDRLMAAGEGWALVDLACHVSDPTTASRAMKLASERLSAVAGWRWPSRLRALGALAALAAEDAARGLGTERVPGSPRRVLRALRHRLTGR